jgi:SAM-dependent methyltransferase
MPNEREQTAESFWEKWHNNRRLAFSETLNEASDIQRWILTRNGLNDLAGLTRWLAPRTRILDAGCGNGRVTALLQRFAPQDTSIVGIDMNAADVAAQNLADLPNVAVQRRDLLADLSDLGLFDLIYCQEVLHHTADPARSFRNLVNLLAPGGEIAIYVYKVKPAIREFSDDLVRSRISGLSYDQAMEAMRQVAELSRALAELRVEITVPDVDVFEIEAGTYDVHRLIYDSFAKLYWNAEMEFEENAAINFDWYHPQLASRHTLEEVEKWFGDAGLRIVHRTVDSYGITVRGVLDE